jgi:predicted nucleotidyltransferase
MRRDEIIAKLREREAELKAAGVASLALFGSVARGDDEDNSDVDVVVRLTDQATKRGFAYFGQIEALRQRLSELLGRPVDLIAEPVSKERLRERIEKDRAVAF